jgi:hypothetical protein
MALVAFAGHCRQPCLGRRERERGRARGRERERARESEREGGRDGGREGAREFEFSERVIGNTVGVRWRWADSKSHESVT